MKQKRKYNKPSIKSSSVKLINMYNDTNKANHRLIAYTPF